MPSRKENPLISIIVPNYNGAKYLKQCLGSLVSQGYENKEIIVVDGYSTDGSLDIIKEYPSVIVIKAEPKGEADAINQGMAYSKGDILTYVDSDDMLPFGTLWKVSRLFGDSKWAIGMGSYIDTDGKPSRQFVARAKCFLLQHYSYTTLRLFDYIIQPAIFWSRELYKEIGEFRTDEKLAFEYEWWLRAGKKYRPTFINSVLGIWRMHSTSITSGGLGQSAKDAMRLQREYTGNIGLKLLQVISYICVRMIYANEKR